MLAVISVFDFLYSVFVQPDSGGAHLVLRTPQGSVERTGEGGDEPNDQGRWVAAQTQGTVPQPLGLVCMLYRQPRILLVYFLAFHIVFRCI